MKKINFGYNNMDNHSLYCEKPIIKEDVFLTEADYYGSIEFDGNYYIVAKVMSLKINNCPQLLGNFIVRQALCDVYANGDSVIILNQDETIVTRQLETYLNSSQIKQNISTIDDVINLTNGAKRSSKAFAVAEYFANDTIFTISKLPEVFEMKNNAINSCQKSISEIQTELSNNYTR